jgi:UDP-2,4-diacetamido-2,4,6-trideoxy-beta-L-altropyranose hydrolase
MKVAFRVDASSRMGTGHVMRCLTLAEALSERGAEVLFVTRDHVGNLLPLLRQFATTVLPRPDVPPASTEDYAAWLGVAQAVDASETARAVQDKSFEWLVVDSYGLDAEWELRIRSHVAKLMVIDDLANRPHECDVLLDQNFSLEGKRRYLGRVPSHCHLLLGPRYALLHPEYARLRKALRRRDGQVKKVVVFFGGADPHNTTAVALKALSDGSLRELAVDVVVGASNPHRQDITRLAYGRPQTSVYGPVPHLAELLAGADLAVGAGGGTTWERMCLGVPSVLVSIAENQRRACEALAAAGLAKYAGHFDSLTPERLADTVQEVLASPGLVAELSLRDQLVVDGLGTRRLLETLWTTDSRQLGIRSARADDIALFFSWANDHEVRRNAFSPDTIAWPAHETWFNEKLRSCSSHLFVLEANGLPVGQVRFDVENGEANIDYSLDELVRGRGWGQRLLSMGMAAMQGRGVSRFHGAVKKGNKASCTVFGQLGFRSRSSESDDRVLFRREGE